MVNSKTKVFKLLDDKSIQLKHKNVLLEHLTFQFQDENIQDEDEIAQLKEENVNYKITVYH